MRKTLPNKCLRLAFLSLVILATTSCKARPTPVPTKTPPLTGTPPVLRSEKSLGEQKSMVLLARFPDVEPQINLDQAREKIFTKLDNYIRQVSYDQTWLEGETKG